jgi:hypothetical protein
VGDSDIDGTVTARMSSVLIPVVGFGLAGVLACSDPSDTRRVIGLIGDGPAGVDLPTDIIRGQPFEVTVYTFGSSSCTTPDGAELKMEGLVARVTPYDLVPTADVPCTADMAPFAHPVTLRFDSKGVATLRIVGWMSRAVGRALDSVDFSFPVHP